VLRCGRPHELVPDGKRRRLWLYFARNCRYEPQGMVAAVLTGTLGRCRVMWP
jgi:hypothetical protein